MTRPTRADTSPPEDNALPALIPAYEKARAALAKTKTLDEVKSIPKEFDRLRAAGRISDDFDFELILAEIKLREFRRIGEISRGLEKSKGGRGKTVSDDGNSFKLTTLAKAGISNTRAYRAENVAAIEQHHFDKYLKECRRARKPVTVNDLLETVATRVRGADRNGRSLETAERQASRPAQQREALHPLAKILQQVERKLRPEKEEQLIELALVAACYLDSSDREILVRLLSDNTVAETIRARKGEDRHLFISRLREGLCSNPGDEELAERGFMLLMPPAWPNAAFMPPARESGQRRVRATRTDAERADNLAFYRSLSGPGSLAPRRPRAEARREVNGG
jgi:hypothetical protein